MFIQLYRSLPDYQLDHLKAWIGRITVNKAIDWKRRQSKYIPEWDTALEKVVDSRFIGPDQQVIQNERATHIKELCRALPPRYKRIVIKYHFEEKSYQQIAREEGISLKTVESRLYRARKMMRERWKEGENEAF